MYIQIFLAVWSVHDHNKYGFEENGCTSLVESPRSLNFEKTDPKPPVWRAHICYHNSRGNSRLGKSLGSRFLDRENDKQTCVRANKCQTFFHNYRYGKRTFTIDVNSNQLQSSSLVFGQPPSHSGRGSTWLHHHLKIRTRHHIFFNLPTFLCVTFALASVFAARHLCPCPTSKNKEIWRFPQTTLTWSSLPPTSLSPLKNIACALPETSFEVHFNSLLIDRTGCFIQLLPHHFQNIDHHNQACFMLEPHSYHNCPWQCSLFFPCLLPINPCLGLLR